MSDHFTTRDMGGRGAKPKHPKPNVIPGSQPNPFGERAIAGLVQMRDLAAMDAPAKIQRITELEAELARLRAACEMMLDAYGLDIFTFKAKYDRKEQADRQTWILLALRTIDAAITNAREVPHPTN
jgi:hypothetical protein